MNGTKLTTTTREEKLIDELVSIPVLFKNLVQPHLEFGNVIWHPRYMDILEVGKVQGEQLHFHLSQSSLQYRRRRGHMIQLLHMIMHGIDRVDQGLLFSSAEYMNTRCHTQKIFQEQVQN